jgi:hypothetical protein
MLETQKVREILDFIQYARFDNAQFKMAGRSASALLELSNEWHNQRAKAAKVGGYSTFKRSGFQPFEKIVGPEGENQEIWTITEILDSKELKRESSLMHHCVWSYGDMISSGKTSIWTMECYTQKLGTYKYLTIEVSNPTKQIRQVRGMYNRPATGKESNLVYQWAQNNGLASSTYCW